MSKVLIFAGTLEGRELAEYLSSHGVEIHVCVATEYGQKLLPKGEGISITANRLDADEMKTLMLEKQVSLVIDATHPYAVIVSENIKQACMYANLELSRLTDSQDTSIEYCRLLRSSSNIESDNCIYLKSIEEAAEYLKKTNGNVLITTGSKELSKFTVVPDYQSRFYARVLSTTNVVLECTQLGFEGKHLICMQGPFSEDLNYAMLKQIDAKYLVTKESGIVGGFEEKIYAAHRAGVKTLIIGRQSKEIGHSYEERHSYGEGHSYDTGITYEECLAMLGDRFHIDEKRKITLVGIGMGAYENMTYECINACENADVLIGAKRMLDALERFHKPTFNSFTAEEINDFIKSHKEYKNVVIALSGDVGFYSGAKKLITELQNNDIKVLPGISSVVYLCSKLQISWDDVKFMSIHGREENIIGAIRLHTKVFSLLGGKDCVNQLCQNLIDYGLKDLVLHVGEQLSYETEKITTGNPEQLKDLTFSELCSVLIENHKAENAVITHGIPDDDFIRSKVPMTKEEIRSISISKMKLIRNSIIYDIGAGTGSVAVEMALQANEGTVYAIEKNPEAIQLIEENKKKFGAANLVTITGIAPMAMEELPVPTHAFIGGSSGNLKEILALLLKKNPSIRIVINAITLETIFEAVNCLKTLEITDEEIIQVSVSKSKSLGDYHMMMGQNPIYIISGTGVPTKAGRGE